MTKFGHLKSLEVQSTATADYPIYDIGESAVLKIAPATEANKPYYNAILRTTKRTAQMQRAKKGIDVALLKQNREEDRKLYPDHIIKGWDGVVDANGKQVKFSKEEAKDLVDALPDWMFDQLRNFASDHCNFVDGIDVEETAKNS